MKLFDKSIFLNKTVRKILTTVFSGAMLLSLCFSFPASASEEQPATGPDWAVDSSAAPDVVAESAILMDVDTGVTLYEKNIHAKEYPASITKILTCLLARENSELADVVTFSHEAVYGIERGSSNIGIDEGEQLSMEDCLYAAMLESANEVAAAMAEFVGGSAEGFAAMMNERTKELGGTDSNFVNANGLPDDNHYTSAYDMALIGRAFFQDEVLSEISGTVLHHISSSPTQKDEIDLRNHHRMLPGCQLSNRHPYEYTVGGKTGYTVVAGNTLVTCAEKDGHRLVCVVLKEKTPNHYLDTIALFDYGFACYEKPAVLAQIEAKAQELQAEEAFGEESGEEGGTAGSGQDGNGGSGANTANGRGEQDGDSAANGAEGQDGTQGGLETVINGGKENSGESGIGQVSGEAGKPGKSVFITVLAVAVCVVVLAAVCVCGYFLYQAYLKERERKRRQAEIMARHRAWKEREKQQNES